MIKAVVFDVDGVLIDSLDANVKFYQDLLVYTGYPRPERNEIFKLLHLPMMDVIRVLTKSSSQEEVEKIWQIGKNREVPYPHALVNIPEKMDGTIKALHKKYSLAIVTSRIKGRVFGFPELANLKNYFKTVVYYEDTQKHKPDPEPLLLVANKLNTIPEEIVYVGDMESDIQAAMAANMKVILFKNKNEYKAKYWTASFKDIAKIITNL